MTTVTNSQTNTNKKDIAKNIFLNVGIPFSFSEKIINDFHISERLVVTFKSSKYLKARINKNVK